jgi:hypothetical protein
MRAAAEVSRVGGRRRRRSQGCSHSSARPDNLKRPLSVECEVDGCGPSQSSGGPTERDLELVSRVESRASDSECLRSAGRRRRRSRQGVSESESWE